MLIIIKEKKLMLLTRANPNGGRPLTGFPIAEDEKTGAYGYKIGYCPCGCNEEILIRTIDVRQVVSYFGIGMEEMDEWKRKLKEKTKIPMRQKVIKFLQSMGD